MNAIKAGGRVWIELENGTTIGQGKIELLRKADELGSLRKAATEMGISYRQAWFKINQINQASSTPFIELLRGGKTGGTAKLTIQGRDLIEKFDRLNSTFKEYLKKFSL